MEEEKLKEEKEEKKVEEESIVEEENEVEENVPVKSKFAALLSRLKANGEIAATKSDRPTEEVEGSKIDGTNAQTNPEPPSEEKPKPTIKRTTEQQREVVKPIWDKLLLGVRKKREQSKVFAWSSMIKKLTRIRAVQKSNEETEPVIADMFTNPENAEAPAPADTESAFAAASMAPALLVPPLQSRLSAKKKEHEKLATPPQHPNKQRKPETPVKPTVIKTLKKSVTNFNSLLKKEESKQSLFVQEDLMAFLNELNEKEEQRPRGEELSSDNLRASADLLRRLRNYSNVDPNVIRSQDEMHLKPPGPTYFEGFSSKTTEQMLRLLGRYASESDTNWYGMNVGKKRGRSDHGQEFLYKHRSRKGKSGSVTDWVQKGLGMYASTNVYDDTQKYSDFFSLAKPGRRKSKPEVYHDPFSKKKTAARRKIFKKEQMSKTKLLNEYEKNYRKHVSDSESDSEYEVSLKRARQRRFSTGYRDHFGRYRSANSSSKWSALSGGSKDGNPLGSDLSLLFKRRPKNADWSPSYEFSVDKRGRQSRSDVNYRNPFRAMKASRSNKWKKPTKTRSNLGKSWSNHEPDNLDALFQRRPKSAGSTLPYESGVDSWTRKQGSKADVYRDPFQHIKQRSTGRFSDSPGGRFGTDKYKSSARSMKASRREGEPSDVAVVDQSPYSKQQSTVNEAKYRKTVKNFGSNNRSNIRGGQAQDRDASDEESVQATYSSAPRPARGYDDKSSKPTSPLNEKSKPEAELKRKEKSAKTEATNQEKVSGKETKKDKEKVEDKVAGKGNSAVGRERKSKGKGKAEEVEEGKEAQKDKEKADTPKSAKEAKKGKGGKSKDKFSKTQIPPEPVKRDENDFVRVRSVAGIPVYTFNYSSYEKFQTELETTKAERAAAAELLQQQLNQAAESHSAVRKQKEKENAIPSYMYKPVVALYYEESKSKSKSDFSKRSETSQDSKAEQGRDTPSPEDQDSFGRKETPVIKPTKHPRTKLKDLFMMELQDGSNAVFYPMTGAVAIAGIAVSERSKERYVHCYNSDPDRIPLAKFSPYGKSWCFDMKTGRKLSWVDDGIVLRSQKGTLMYKWEWPNDGTNKLKKALNFQLNPEMRIRVVGKNDIQLLFKCNDSTFKMNVGSITGGSIPEFALPDPTNTQMLRYITSLRAALTFERHTHLSEPKVQTRMKRLVDFRKRPSLVKDLKDILVATTKVRPAEEAPPTESSNQLQKVTEGWEAYKERYLKTRGRTSAKVKPPCSKIEKVNLSPNQMKKVIKTQDVKVEEEKKKNEDEDPFQTYRSPSAPPLHMVPGPHSLTVADKRSPLPKRKPPAEPPVERLAIPNEETEGNRRLSSGGTVDGGRLEADAISPSVQGSHSAFVLDRLDDKRFPLECQLCPVATRKKLIHLSRNIERGGYNCYCSPNRIPVVSDIEFDYFLHMIVPSSQLIVVSLSNTLYPRSNPYESTLEHIYIEKNRKRNKPCLQSRMDQFRIVRYDFATATAGTQREMPLLLARHNAIPGMVLIYGGGRLLFADHIFDGYGNSKKDFLKQLYKTRRDYGLGKFLPDDFSFTPQPGKLVGPRTPWGGEMGGAGVQGSGLPGVYFGSNCSPEEIKKLKKQIREVAYVPGRSNSHPTDTPSGATLVPEMSKILLNAMDFIRYSLSTKMYVLHQARPDSPLTLSKKGSDPASENQFQISIGTTSSLQRFLPPIQVPEPPQKGELKMKPYKSLRTQNTLPPSNPIKP